MTAADSTAWAGWADGLWEGFVGWDWLPRRDTLTEVASAMAAQRRERQRAVRMLAGRYEREIALRAEVGGGA